MRVAVELADRHGLTAVTVREVARRTGTEPAATQRAVGSRDRLVAAMAHEVLTRRAAERPPAPSSPVERLTWAARHEWEAYRHHPWLVSVLASTRPPVDAAVLDTIRPVMEAFEALGFDPPTAFSRFLALSGYVQGMALLLQAEYQEEADTGTSYRAWWAAEARRMERRGHHHHHPWLEHRAESGYLPEQSDIDAWFRAGLGPVIAGLAGLDATDSREPEGRSES